MWLRRGGKGYKGMCRKMQEYIQGYIYLCNFMHQGEYRFWTFKVWRSGLRVLGSRPEVSSSPGKCRVAVTI